MTEQPGSDADKIIEEIPDILQQDDLDKVAGGVISGFAKGWIDIDSFAPGAGRVEGEV